MTAAWVTASAPAKINLHLGVGPVRPDGYHPLATVYQAIGLYDEVTVAPAPAYSVTVTGDGARRHRRARSTTPTSRSGRPSCSPSTPACTAPSSVRIDKRIPVAGGLAGGSRTPPPRWWPATRSGGSRRRASS